LKDRDRKVTDVAFEEARRQANQIVAAIASLQGVDAISLGGSFGSGLADSASDIDLHVYWSGELAASSEREALIRSIADADSIRMDVTYWGLEDHFRVAGQEVELVYVNSDELLADVERAYSTGLYGEGYVTATFFYVTQSAILHDPQGMLERTRSRLEQSYPEATRRNTLGSNPNILRAYLGHLRKAQTRGDLLFVQQRLYSIQMVFFNLLFALNRRYHPGEKRLLIHGESCPIRPSELAQRWQHSAELLVADPALVDLLEGLIDEICVLAANN
jgi:predicted nucleotidyltransferase